MGYDASFHRAFLKAQMGAGVKFPREGVVFLSIKEADKGPLLVETAQALDGMGFRSAGDWRHGGVSGGPRDCRRGGQESL